MWARAAARCGAFVNLNGIQLPEYALIPWTLSANEDQVGVIHTLCIHPGQSGRGYARQMVAFCEEEARRLGKNRHAAGHLGA